MIIVNKRAQTTIEYVIILIIVLGAFISISNYMKRGIQGRWKAATDDLGDQYDPRVAESLVEFKQVLNSTTRIHTVSTNGLFGTYTYRDDTSQIVETKNGFVSVGSY